MDYNSVLFKIILGVVCYVAGVLSERYIFKITTNPIKFEHVVATLVLSLFATSIIAEIIKPEYTINPLFYGLAGLILSHLFPDAIPFKIGGKKQ